MFLAILAAALFGVSSPLAKLLLGNIEPILLAAFLYLGSGFGLLFIRSFHLFSISNEARVGRNDLPWLAGSILTGGVAAPIILFFSLRHTPAATASLLLNFEGVATALVAGLAFKEAIGKRIWLAIGTITGASALLSLNIGGQWGLSLGAVGVLCACLLWGIDNNFTRNISGKDPLTITMIKGLGAGAFSLVLAFVLHNPFPGMLTVFKAMLLGSVSYGASIVLFILAMRNLGAARTSTLFGTAPFVGAVLSFLLFRESPGALFAVSAPMMIVGAMLLLGEGHSHIHKHPFLQHEHRHRHDDEHHIHYHISGEIPPNDYHSHLHTHEAIEHCHPHAPDIHHRHSHRKAKAMLSPNASVGR
ncbi:MAG: DMT family transporter [Firmicutes bacterium]|nr:DMT family transporter [Bacillota bacterium]